MHGTRKHYLRCFWDFLCRLSRNARRRVSKNIGGGVDTDKYWVLQTRPPTNFSGGDFNGSQ